MMLIDRLETRAPACGASMIMPSPTLEGDVREAAVEDQVARLELGAADPRGGVVLHRRVVRQRPAGLGPGGEGQARAVVPGRARAAPLVRRADHVVREPHRGPGAARDVRDLAGVPARVGVLGAAVRRAAQVVQLLEVLLDLLVAGVELALLGVLLPPRGA